MTENHELRSLPPEARGVQGRPAGAVTRGLSNIVDSILVTVCLIAFGAGLSVIARARHFEADVSPLILVGFSWAAVWAYLTVCWAFVGRTIGQGMLGLRVVIHRGRRYPVLRAGARAWLCVTFPYLWFTLLLDPSSRHLIDRVVSSTVIYDWRHRHPTDGEDAVGAPA